MYFACAFKESLLINEINNNIDESRILKKAYSFFENNDIEKGHDTISQLVSNENADALVLSSMFSKKDENLEQFNKRHIQLLELASLRNNSLALYSLGVYYDTGDYVKEDKKKAFDFFKKAAENGMPQAQHIYGIMLYYGTGGAAQDKQKGLSLINAAVKANIVEAAEFLEYLKK